MPLSGRVSAIGKVLHSRCHGGAEDKGSESLPSGTQAFGMIKPRCRMWEGSVPEGQTLVLRLESHRRAANLSRSGDAARAAPRFVTREVHLRRQRAKRLNAH